MEFLPSLLGQSEELPAPTDPVVVDLPISGVAPPDLGVVHLIGQADWVVKGVMLVLLLASVACWGIAAVKWWQMRRVGSRDRAFLKLFWDGRTLGGIYEQTPNFRGGVLAEIFRAGYRELKQLSALGGSPSREGLVDAVQTVGLDTVERALDAETTIQIQRLERSLGTLATTASAAPFIGLFGTVWGIMNAFIGLSASGGGTSIEAVAPGIAEALVATAAGLAAAIPAVLFYNIFANQIRALGGHVAGFRAEFLNLAQRQVLKNSSWSTGAVPQPGTGHGTKG